MACLDRSTDNLDEKTFRCLLDGLVLGRGVGRVRGVDLDAKHATAGAAAEERVLDALGRGTDAAVNGVGQVLVEDGRVEARVDVLDEGDDGAGEINRQRPFLALADGSRHYLRLTS